MSRFLALDVDARSLSVAVARTRGSAVEIERTLALTADSTPISSLNAVELGAKLKALLKAAGVKPAPLLVVIGRERVILKEVRFPPTPPADEPMIVRFQAIRDLTESPDDVVMDYIPMPSPNPDVERRAMVLFIRKDIYQAAKQLAESAGLRLAGVTPRPLAAPAALQHAFDTGNAAPLENPLAPVAVVALWELGGEFTVVRGGEVAFTRSLSASATTSEQSLTLELRRNLSVYAGQNPNTPVRAIYLSEGDDPATSWAIRLYDTLPVPVYPFDPIAGAPGADAVPAKYHGRFFGPVGLLALMGAGPLPINFVTPRQPRAEAKRVGARVLVAVALGALVVAFVGVIAYLDVSKANRRVAEATQRRDALDDELKLYDVDSKRLAAADEFASREVVWLDELYDLSDRVPDVGKATVTEVDGATLVQTKAAPKLVALGSIAVKDTKAVPVSSMRITLRTGNEQIPQKMVDAYKSDKFYVSINKVVGGTGSGDPTTKGQIYVLTSQILHRTSAEFVRKLNVLPPLKSVPIELPAGGEPGELLDVDGGFGP